MVDVGIRIKWIRYLEEKFVNEWIDPALKRLQ
jgi:hypothetical protein